MQKKVIFGHESKLEKEIIFVSQKDFQSPHLSDDSASIAIQEINKIQDLIYQGKEVPKVFSYEGISLWWFFYPQIFFVLEKTIDFIKNFSNFLEKENPSSVSISKDFSRLEIMDQICKGKQVNLRYSKMEYSKYKISKKIKNSLKHSALSLLTQRKIQKRKNLFNEKKRSYELNNSILFLAGPLYHRGIFNQKKNKTEKGEYIIQNLIDLIKDEYNIVCVDTFNKIRSDDKVLSERLNSDLTWIPLEIFFTKNKKSNKKKFLEKFEQIISSKEFHDLFKFQNLFIWSSLEETFTKLKFGPYLPYWIDLIDSLNTVFSSSKPKTIFLVYETGPISLAFINICKKFQIRTIGVQHGLITKYHKYYSHNKFVTKTYPYGFPLPDKLLLHGNITKKILLEKGYPEEKLIKFGNPVFFNLNKIESYLRNQPLFEKYGIKKGKKIILLATTGLQAEYHNTKKYDFDTQTWKVLLEKFSNDPNIQLVLKPHPAEDSKEYQKVLEKFSSSDAKIIQGNLLELLFISSLTISIISSTIFDSFAMKRPVIQVKFGNYILSPWDDYPLKVVYSTEINDLSYSIQKVLSNMSLYNDLINNGNKFINDHYSIPEKTPELDLKRIIEE